MDAEDGFDGAEHRFGRLLAQGVDLLPSGARRWAMASTEVALSGAGEALARRWVKGLPAPPASPRAGSAFSGSMPAAVQASTMATLKWPLLASSVRGAPNALGKASSLHTIGASCCWSIIPPTVVSAEHCGSSMPTVVG